MARLWTHPKLHLRYMRRDDLPHAVEMLAKPSVTASVFFGPNTEAETRGYFEPILDGMEADEAAGRIPQAPDFTLLDPETGAFMGNAALERAPFAEGNWIIGYQLDEPYWGRGVGTWAARFLVVHGFQILGARRLTADCFGTNVASARILKGLGFVMEGCQREYYLKDGALVDNLIFGLNRKDISTRRLRAWAKSFEAL